MDLEEIASILGAEVKVDPINQTKVYHVEKSMPDMFKVFAENGITADLRFTESSLYFESQKVEFRSKYSFN